MSDLLDCTVHGILQARILEWVAIPFSRVFFPIRGLNPGLLHCRRSIYQLSHKGSPRILEWVASHFSSGFPDPGIRVFCFANSLPTELSGKPPNVNNTLLNGEVHQLGVVGW